MEKTAFLAKNMFSGKTIYRSLFFFELKKSISFVKGNVLDIGSGTSPSYFKYLPKNISYKKTDYVSKDNSVDVLDFNQKFPFADDSFDTVFLFHNLYISKDPNFTMKEIYRVLKKGGCLLISSPFSTNEMPEPHDYVRFSKEGLDILLEKNSFRTEYFSRIGERFSNAFYSISPMLYFNLLKTFFGLIAIFLDKMIPKKLKQNYPFPIGYFYVTRK